MSDFDCAFLEMMIPTTRARSGWREPELESGIHAELRRMSENIIDSQGFEIRQMRRFSAGGGGSSEHPRSGEPG